MQRNFEQSYVLGTIIVEAGPRKTCCPCWKMVCATSSVPVSRIASLKATCRYVRPLDDVFTGIIERNGSMLARNEHRCSLQRITAQSASHQVILLTGTLTILAHP